MSENLFKMYTQQFTANLQLKLQQTGSLLRGRTMEGPHVGKAAAPVNYVGAVQSRMPAGRFAPMNRVDADFERRWVFPQEREIPQLIDTFDELETIVDPKSAYSENAANACGRDWDDAIITAAFGNASTGTDTGGLSTETFDATTYGVAADFKTSSTNTGLTIPKLIEAKRIMRHNHVPLDRETLTLMIGSQQEADLLNLAQVQSTEFNPQPVIVDGKVTRLFGFDIAVSERLGTKTVNSAACRQCIAFVKSGLYLGLWRDMTNDVDRRKDLSGLPFQLYTMHMYGATRLEKGRVVEIDAVDATGTDITP